MKTYSDDQVIRHHKKIRIDEYIQYDKDKKKVQQFIKNQKQKFQQNRQNWKDFTEQYYKISSLRRDSRVKSIPQKYDNYQYYTQTAWKNNIHYSKIYRIQDGKQQLALDIMQYQIIIKNSSTVQLLNTSFSPSHRLIAFCVDLKNNQKNSYFIIDTHSNRQLLKTSRGPIRLQDVNDVIFLSQKILYYLKSQQRRPCKLYRYDLESGKSQLLYQDENSQFYYGLKLSKDKKYVILSGCSKTSSKIYLLNQNKFHQIWKGQGKVYINHIQNFFVIWQSNNSTQIKIVYDIAFEKSLKQKNIQNLKNIQNQILFVSSKQQQFDEIDLIKNNIILYGFNVVYPLIRVINIQKQKQKITAKNKIVDLPYKFGVVKPNVNQNYQSITVQYSISTPFVYDQVWEFELQNLKSTIIQPYEYEGPKFNQKKYLIQVLEIPSTDYKKIPMTIIGPKNKKTQKLLFQFYGFYGLSTRVGYDNVNLAALQKGWTICYAHIRGGNQKGKEWHQDARKDRQRSLLDIQQCIGYLLRQKYTHPSLLFLQSSSAGAITLWQTILKRPYLYKGAIFKAPFLDVMTQLLDINRPLTITDHQQFGNPIQNYQSYQLIQSISPYENIYPRQYPAIHISIGEEDYRTPINQIAKFVKRFRDRALTNPKLKCSSENLITVDISKTGSHLGEADVKSQNYKGCDVFGYMDYIIYKCSNDCSKLS